MPPEIPVTDILSVLLGTAVLFAAVLFSLTVSPQITKKLLAPLAGITAIGGLAFYGYGYAMVSPPVVAVFQATFAMCKMFVGTNAWGDIDAYITHWLPQTLFWLLHLTGLFTAASAAVNVLGTGVMRKLRQLFFRRRSVSIVYGLNPKALDFAGKLIRSEKASVVFIDPSPDSALAHAVDPMGAILRTDTDATRATVRFLQSLRIRPGTRKLSVYALHADLVANQKFAARLLDALQQQNIQPDQTSLTLLGPGDDTHHRFQNSAGHYGYGSIVSINESEMAARMLIRRYPPCNTLTFREDGTARQDFHALIIGAGHTGQAVLQQLVMNGQFVGSNFRLAMFDPRYEQKMGRMFHECEALFDRYDITFHPYDGRSRQIYDYIRENMTSIRYIVISTGEDAINLEIADQLRGFLHRGQGCAAIYTCSSRGIGHRISDDQYDTHKIYVPEILCSGRIDQMAMVLNQYYAGQGDIQENWRSCGYFNRMSSRAAADFWPAHLRVAGTTEAEARKHWAPEGELLETLSVNEHLRWEAFHYCMGFRPMTEEEFRSRADAYRKEKEKDPNTRYRITRDMDKRIHACMIPWDALDAYSEKENAVTGGSRDYQENDRLNIRAIGEVLKATDLPK